MRSLDSEALLGVRAAALSRAPISLGSRRTASPHEFYPYPARFAPEFADMAIRAFTQPGDVVADFFVGGDTTLVEARRAGRLGIGSDINSLSVFVSTVKTRLYNLEELHAVALWASRAADRPPTGASSLPADDALLGYFRNLTSDETQEQRQFMLGAIAAVDAIASPRAKALARCVMLRTAQWAFDMRSEIPSADQLRLAFTENASTMIAVAGTTTNEYRSADQLASSSGLRRSFIIHQALPGVARRPGLWRYPAPRLVLTSPPYPGVYVNYHRWKVRGRQETPLPYFLAGREDGNGLAYYTMAARSDPTLNTYFSKLEAAFRDVALMCDTETFVVQVVGFNNVEDQLHRYLQVMQQAGFIEVKFDDLASAEDGRLWRDVPGRRWWAHAGDRAEVAPNTAREVVLVHRLRT